jgi:YD repeat-containing protein
LNRGTLTGIDYTTEGLPRTFTNANGNITRFAYDERGDLRILSPSEGIKFALDYNSLGFATGLSILTEAGEDTGRNYEIENDAHGRTTALVYPDGLSKQIAYDGLGEIIQTVDRAGRITDYERVPTALASVTRYLHEGGTSTPVRIGYDLDQLTNILRIEEPSGAYVESYQLDIQDRITSVTNIEGQALSMSYVISNKVDTLTRFDGSTLTHTYDEAGRLQDTVYPDATLTRSYSAIGELKTLSERAPSGAEELSGASGATRIAYMRDSLNRLTNTTTQTEALSYTNHYAHDLHGNRTNALVEVGGHRFETAYRYDTAERELHSNAISSGTTNATHYSYSPLNGRLETVSNTLSGITTRYQHDLLDQLTNITYRTASGSLIKSIGYERDALVWLPRNCIPLHQVRTATDHSRMTHLIVLSTNTTARPAFPIGTIYAATAPRKSVMGLRLPTRSERVTASTTPPPTPPTS